MKDDKKQQMNKESGDESGEEMQQANTIMQQEIIISVEAIKYNDRTEDVIDKLRKINKLFDRQRNLTK